MDKNNSSLFFIWEISSIDTGGKFKAGVWQPTGKLLLKHSNIVLIFYYLKVIYLYLLLLKISLHNGRFTSIMTIPKTTVIPNPLKAFWLCTWKILDPLILACVTDLECALARIILADLLGITSPEMIGWKSVHRHGSGTFKVSAKLWVNIPRKMDESILHVHFWIKVWIAIVVARSYSQMIRGSWLPSPLRDQKKDWDPELGLRLAQ